MRNSTETMISAKEGWGGATRENKEDALRGREDKEDIIRREGSALISAPRIEGSAL